MASSNEGLGSLLNIERLNGTNFPFWKAHFYNVLVQKKQVKHIKFKGVKPKPMDVEEWSELDELAKSTIMLSFNKSVYSIMSIRQRPVMSCGTSYEVYSSKRVPLHRFACN